MNTKFTHLNGSKIIKCNFILGYLCWIAMIFGTLKGWSLLIDIFASNNCFSYRKIFQNSVDAVLKLDDAHLTKSWKFHIVQIIWYCSNFASLWHKYLLWYTDGISGFRWQNFFATVIRNNLLEHQHRFLYSSSFMFPLLLLTVEVENTICDSLLFLPQTGKIWRKSMIWTTQNLDP